MHSQSVLVIDVSVKVQLQHIFAPTRICDSIQGLSKGWAFRLRDPASLLPLAAGGGEFTQPMIHFFTIPVVTYL